MGKEGPEEIALSGNAEGEEGLNFARKIWNDAGEALAKKLTKKEGVEHTVADALQGIAEKDNALLDKAMQSDSEAAARMERVIKGTFKAK